MANLSNINNKFLVTTGGNVGIGVTGPVTKLELPSSTTNSSLKVGTVETQSYSVNNAWVADNVYYDGAFRLRSAGYASQIYFGVANGGGDISFKRYPTGSAGDAVTGVTSMQLLGDGKVYIPGNVGIGTATPQKKLHIEGPGGAGASQLFVTGASDTVGSTAGILLRAEGGEGDSALRAKGAIFFERESGSFGTGKMHLAVNGNQNNVSASPNDAALTINDNRFVGIGTKTPKAVLEVSAANVNKLGMLRITPGAIADYGLDIGLDPATGDPVFSTIVANVVSESFRIQRSTGNVGINDTTPSFPLVVSKSSSTTSNGADLSMRLSLNNPDQTNNNWALINFSDGTSEPGSGFMGMQFTDHTNNYGDLVFGPRGPVYGEKMRITSGGNVAIGTDSPKAKLDVFRAAGQSSVCAISITTGESNNRSWGLSTEVRAAGDFALLVSPSASTIPAPTDDNIRMYMTSGGDVAFAMNDYNSGPSASNYGLRLLTGATGKSYWQSAVNAATSHYHYEFINTNGSVGTIQTSGSATSYVTNSDYRLKEDLQDFNGLDKVSKIPVYNFKWKIDDTRSYGVMAHELDVVLPDAVSGEKDDVNEDKSINPQGVDYSKIVPLLVKSIQELKAEIEILKKK